MLASVGVTTSMKLTLEEGRGKTFQALAHLIKVVAALPSCFNKVEKLDPPAHDS
jgi:hypothetical protein